MLSDADGRQREAFVVPIDPVAIVVARTRKADHFPGRHIAVAAVDRIGEEAFLRVVEQLVEETFRAGDFQRAVFEPGDDLILALVRQLRERFAAERIATVLVERCQRLAIELRRGGR